MLTEPQAVAWVKENRQGLLLKFANPSRFISDARPVTMFMAGSPGAGKTELSLRLMEPFKQRPVRIDADEIRKNIPGYVGSQAHVYQAASSVGVEKLYDWVLKKKMNVIIDGTFSHSKVSENVTRSLRKNREVSIHYLHQDPLVSWEFTKKREAIEYRNIPKDAFIEAYFRAQVNVSRIKEEFGKKIVLNVVIKDFKKQLMKTYFNADGIDSYVKEKYDRKSLREALS